MFERINKKVKGFFSSQRMKTLALMLLVGTTAAMAQNAAGDYSAGTTALTTVTEEIAKYVPIVVKLCYAIAGRSHKRLHRHEQRGTGRQKEDHDGRRRMYFPHCSSPGTASVLRHWRLNAA